MSFEEKSTWAVLISFILVYGWYFLGISGSVLDGDVSRIEYQALMVAAVAALIVVSIATHILIAIVDPDTADQVDERDREISIRGGYIGSYIVGAAALMAMGMALMEMAHFWIANALLLGLVIAELAANCIKLYFYRRGF